MKISKKEDINKLFDEADFVIEDFQEPKKSGRIALPVTPGEWVGTEATYVPATRVNLNNRVQYFRRVDLNEMATKDKMIVTTLDGRETLINTRYVINADYCTFALCALNSKNPYHEGRGLYCTIVKDGETLTLVNAKRV